MKSIPKKPSPDELTKRNTNLRKSESRDMLLASGGSRLEVNLSAAGTKCLEALIELRGETGIKGAKKNAVEEALEIALHYKKKQ